jgi:hypothetical protein
VFSTLPLQVAGVHTVSAAYFEQPPVPSQVPVCPQVEAAVWAQTPCGSTAPCVVGQQVPMRPLWLQLTQGPAQGLLQQILSAQNPFAHCPLEVHEPPIGLSPQLPLTHLTLATQSASEAQVSMQSLLLASQLNGAQSFEGPALQLPAPSQIRMPPTEAPAQVPAWQTVPSG